MRKLSRSLARVCVRWSKAGSNRCSPEALITLGTALARLERDGEALTSLRRGAEIAEQAGDPDTAGIASLTIVEELESVVPQPERRELLSPR